MEATFTPAQKQFNRALSAHVRANPASYAKGALFLLTQYSESATRERALVDWNSLRQVPGWDRLPALHHQNRMPQLGDVVLLSERINSAVADLISSGLSIPDDDLTPVDLAKAEAVLFITWLIVDKDADKTDLGRPFGQWSTRGGREWARMALCYDENRLAAWIKLAELAWAALNSETSTRAEPHQASSIAAAVELVQSVPSIEPPAPPREHLITPEDFATIAGQDPRHIRRQISNGKLEPTLAVALERKRKTDQKESNRATEGLAEAAIQESGGPEPRRPKLRYACQKPPCTWEGQCKPDEDCPRCGGDVALAPVAGDGAHGVRVKQPKPK